MDGSKTIGITGAGGFIGKELSNYLYKKKYNLVLFSENEIIKDKDIKYIKKDLRKCSAEDFMGIDVLIHLAGTSFNKDALEMNFNLTDITIKNSINAKIKKFFLASSYSVYGDRNIPANTDDSLNPLDDYALSKILSEYLLKKEILSKKLDGSILRICSIYGQEGRGLINVLKEKIKNNQEIFLDGNFERQYLYVKDLCVIIENILNQEEQRLIYNIEGERKSTKDIYLSLKNKDIKIIFENKLKDSYLCSGTSIKRNMEVDKFLFENI